MLPCVGQGAVGLEVRANDERIKKIAGQMNHLDTFQCVTAERAFLRGMGGGCQSPVAAYAEVIDDKISMRAVSYHHNLVRRADAVRPSAEASLLGEQIATQLK